MICAWCNAPIADYGTHFAAWAGKPCRIAALANTPHALARPTQTQVAASEADRAKIRTSALADEKRTRHRDRLETQGVATFARPERERRGRT